MDRKQLPVGVTDFAELIRENYYFVDKSLFIKELLDSGAKVTLLPRPRRFGKTINMSMVRYFFEKTEKSNRHLFAGLTIEQHPKCMAKQGQYPVIFLTFKDVKVNSWVECLNKLKFTIADEIDRHYDIISTHLRPQEHIDIKDMIARSADQTVYESVLADLSTYLHRAYGVRPLILIDEYDTPIHEAYDRGYYDEIVSFMRNFLSAGFKDNSDLEFGILTGILRITKESIFSGLNNLEVNTFLQEAYSDKFGLLETEVAELLKYFGRQNNLAQVRAWYDGYQTRTCKLYNPWSIINFAKTGDFSPYWANSSGKDLFTRFARETLSVFDVTGQNPEKFYHGLVLGMLASLRGSHDVLSNQESGFGRYDVSIVPKDITKPGIIFEFKVVNKDRNETLESAVKDALKQIEDRQYEAAMHARGITNIIKIGIAFQGKENLMMFES